jgi:catechol 2,3-dioxygenase-like lactoylglutathione lyase family enzyme
MIDHTGINVSNFEKSKEFYTKILNPLGYQLIKELDTSGVGFISLVGFGAQGAPDFWISQGEVNTPEIYIAFRAETREIVHVFYMAALDAETIELLLYKKT